MGGHADANRRRRRLRSFARSSAVNPPHTPCFSFRSIAHTKHSSRTGHSPHTNWAAIESPIDNPSPGVPSPDEKNMAGDNPAHAARSTH